MPEFTFLLLKQPDTWLKYCITHYSDLQLDMEIVFNCSVSNQHVVVNMTLDDVSLLRLFCLTVIE